MVGLEGVMVADGLERSPYPTFDQRLEQAECRVGDLVRGDGMTPAPEDAPYLKDVMAAVGYLLLYWSRTEAELAEAIVRLRKHTTPSSPDHSMPHHTAHKIAIWTDLMKQAAKQTPPALASLSDDLKETLRIRNAICHGMVSAIGNPIQGQAGLVILQDGERSTIEYSLLQELVDRARSAVNAVRVVTDQCISNSP